MIGIERPIVERRRQTGPHLYKPDEVREIRDWEQMKGRAIV